MTKHWTKATGTGQRQLLIKHLNVKEETRLFKLFGQSAMDGAEVWLGGNIITSTMTRYWTDCVFGPDNGLPSPPRGFNISTMSHSLPPPPSVACWWSSARNDRCPARRWSSLLAVCHASDGLLLLQDVQSETVAENSDSSSAFPQKPGGTPSLPLTPPPPRDQAPPPAPPTRTAAESRLLWTFGSSCSASQTAFSLSCSPNFLHAAAEEAATPWVC